MEKLPAPHNNPLEELEQVAAQLGVRVSYEPMAGLVSGTGGLCRLRGEYRIIIDRRLKPSDRVQILVDALQKFDTADCNVSHAIRGLLS